MSLLEDVDNMLAMFKISSTFIQQCTRKSLPPCSSSSANAVNVITDTIPHWERDRTRKCLQPIDNFAEMQQAGKIPSNHHSKSKQVANGLEIHTGRHTSKRSTCVSGHVHNLDKPGRFEEDPYLDVLKSIPRPSMSVVTNMSWSVLGLKRQQNFRSKITVVNFVKLILLVPCVKISVRIDMRPRIWANTFLDM